MRNVLRIAQPPHPLPQAMAEAKGRINSLSRGLQVLDILNEKGSSVGVSELSRLLSVDKSTAHRLLSTLSHQDYVRQDPETKRYSLGLKVIELSRNFFTRLELRREARPFLKELGQKTGEAVILAALIQDAVIRIDSEESRNFQLVVTPEIGTEAPAHCSTSGKAILAWLGDEEVERIIAKKGLKQYTPKTITSLAQLKQHLRQIRKQEYAFDDGEVEAGLRCIGAPLRDRTGKVMASVVISGPSTRLTLDLIPKLADTVREVAAKISAQLGFRE